MEMHEVITILQEENPRAKQTAIYRDGGSKDYETETSIGTIRFHVPIAEQQRRVRYTGQSVDQAFPKEMNATELTSFIRLAVPPKGRQFIIKRGILWFYGPSKQIMPEETLKKFFTPYGIESLEKDGFIEETK